jgi:hypothetical protein
MAPAVKFTGVTFAISVPINFDFKLIFLNTKLQYLTQLPLDNVSKIEIICA